MIGYGGRFAGGLVQGEAQCKLGNALRSIRRARHILQYVTCRADEMIVRAGRFADGSKAAGVEFFAACRWCFHADATVRTRAFTVSMNCIKRVRPFSPLRYFSHEDSKGRIKDGRVQIDFQP